MSIKFLVLGGGGSADFIFVGARIFLIQNNCHCISWEKPTTIKMRLSNLCCFSCALGRQYKVGPQLTLFSNPLPTPLLTRALKNYFYRHFGVSDSFCSSAKLFCVDSAIRTETIPNLDSLLASFSTGKAPGEALNPYISNQGISKWHFSTHGAV